MLILVEKLARGRTACRHTLEGAASKRGGFPFEAKFCASLQQRVNGVMEDGNLLQKAVMYEGLGDAIS